MIRPAAECHTARVPTSHAIVDGDSVIGLSDRSGFLATTIWDDGANADLRQRRTDMNILLPGDVVVIPDLRKKFEKRPTGCKHRFRRKGIPAVFRLQLFDMNVAVAAMPYTLTVNGVAKTGKTDGQGVVQQFVPATARTGELKLGEGDNVFTMNLQFGYLDPLNEISGVQNRLTNLGYDCGSETGKLNEATKLALLDFQRDNSLEKTGEIDAATKAKLGEIYDKPYKYPPPDDGASN